MKTGAAITGWQAHRGEVMGVQFSTDETSVYSVGSDDKMYLNYTSDQKLWGY